MRIEQIWYGKGLAARLGQVVLFPLHLLYLIGWKIYIFGYKVGFKKAASPHQRVICVGNFAAGGNGKTPVTIWIAEQLVARGFQVVIGCSGYGSPRAEAASLAPAGELDPGEWGDEPAEFRFALADVPLIVGRRRVLAAELCAEHFPSAVLLMDDGMQHLPLKKKVTIALDRPDASNRLCFPAGPYREPRSLSRADVILPNFDFEVRYSESRFVDTLTGLEVSISEGNLFTAIGRPDLLMQSLEGKVNLVQIDIRPDHDTMTELPVRQNELPWILTRKDWMKVRRHSRVGDLRFVVVDRRAFIEPAEEFIDWLIERAGLRI